MSLHTVTLIEPPGAVLQSRLSGRTFGEVLTHFPKHSQLMIAAAIRDTLNVRIELLDMKAERRDRTEQYGSIPYGSDTLEKLMVGSPLADIHEPARASEIVGVTANYTYESGIVVRLIQYAKSANPSVKVIVGGSDATGRPEVYLRAGADVIVLGKGEETAPNVVKALIEQTPFNSIAGIAYRDSAGTIRANQRGRRSFANTAQLPLPALDIGEKYEWNQAAEGGLPAGVSSKIGVLETSRGCDEACSFCATTFQIGRFRDMPLSKIKENIDHLVRNGRKTAVLIDDNILYRTKSVYGGSDGRTDLIEMFNYMRELKLSWTFYNGIQFGLLEQGGVVDTTLIDAMFRNNNATRGAHEPYVGAFRAYIPLERLTEEGRLQFKKLRSFSVQDRIIHEIASRTPVGLNLGFIVGYHDDSAQDFERIGTRATEVKHLISAASGEKTTSHFIPFCLIPIPGTPDYERAVKERRFCFDIQEHPELMNGYTAILRSKHLTPYDITDARLALAQHLNS
jgi:hypothetical protein